MSQPRRLLHLISSLDGYGQSRQLRQLVDQQLAEGCEVQIVAFRADRRERRLCEQAGIVCRVLEQRWQYDPIAAWRLAQQLREQPYELLHVWDLAALQYTKFVRPATDVAPCLATLAKRPTGRFGASANCFVVPHQQECDTDSTVAIPPGIAPLAREPLPRDEFFRLLALPADARVIAMAGQLTRGKSLEEAIWCFELVRTLDERAKLLIFGNGSDRHRLERFARLASVPSDIRFLGYRDDFESWLPHVEVFWQPTGGQSPEGPPLAALEAMASRVPVVASDVAAHRQCIEDGRTGYLFPVASRAVCARHTMRLLQDTQQAAEVAKVAAGEVARRFSLPAFLSNYAKIYDRLLAGSPASG